MKQIKPGEVYACIVVLFLLLATISHLCFALQQSRANERELSRRIYEMVRGGVK